MVVSGAEFFGIGCDADDDEDDFVEVEVWWTNWNTVEVFRVCQPQLVGGMGVWWHGVSAAEVYSGCQLLHIDREEWPEVAAGVQFMARVVAEYRNDEASKERARSKGK